MSNKKQRTYARNRALSRRGNEIVTDSDGAFFLKLVTFAILGMVWLRFGTPVSVFGMVFNAFPVGFLVAALAIPHVEKYHFNRKIWYVVLLMTALVSFMLPIGLVI